MNEVGFKRKLGLLHSFTNEVIKLVNHSVGTYALAVEYRRSHLIPMYIYTGPKLAN